MIDTLSDILRVFKLGSAFYFQNDFESPWGMDIDGSVYAQFHLVVRGTCTVFHEGLEAPVQLSAGDVVVFPKGTEHWIADAPESKRRPGTQVVQQILNPVAGNLIVDQKSTVEQKSTLKPRQSMTLICGHFSFDREIDHPLMRSLPAMMHVKNNDAQQTAWLATTSQLIIQESSAKRPGSSLILERLAEVLLIHVFRAYLIQHKQHQGFPKALLNPHISISIDAMHSNPEYPWTIEGLARKAGMSRTAFAVLFKELTGSTPMQYCLNWRMTLAYQYLRNTEWSIPLLAERVGYSSEAAFSRAFKRQFSKTPARVRKSMS